MRLVLLGLVVVGVGCAGVAATEERHTNHLPAVEVPAPNGGVVFTRVPITPTATSTATRTATPTPVATSTRVPTSTPTETVVPAVLTVRRVSERTADGSHHLYFEVVNGSLGTAFEPRAVVTYYHATGVVAGSAVGDVALNAIGPGEASPASSQADPQPGWASYEIAVVPDTSPSMAYVHDGLPVSRTNRYRSGSTVHVVGLVTNTTGRMLCSVRVVATLYRSDGAVIAWGSSAPFGWSPVGYDGVEPGASTSFDVTFYDSSNLFGDQPAFTVNAEGNHSRTESERQWRGC